MKVLTLQIKKENFDAILAGEQKVEHRYIWPSNESRYLYYECQGKRYKREEDLPNDDSPIEIMPIKYDCLCLINGRRKNAPRLTIEIERAEIVFFTDEDGNDIYYEENGKSYVACQVWYYLGDVVSTENV